MKTCSTCGRRHTPSDWAALQLIGVQRIEADDEGPAETLELRNCVCGSTLAITQGDRPRPIDRWAFGARLPRYELLVEVNRRIEPEDIPVRGNVMSSGDDRADREAEDAVLEQLDQGNTAAWCYAVAEVTIGLSDDGRMPPRSGAHVWTGRDTLGGCSYASEEELWEQDAQNYDLVGNAMREALEKALSAAYVEGLGYGPTFRKHLAKALHRWLARNPDWAVWTDQWLEKL